MARVERFEIEIETGMIGTRDVPRFGFNGYPMRFVDTRGGTGPGETFVGSFAPRSVAHEFVLYGPDNGSWEIARIRVRFEVGGGRTYDVRFGRVTLDETNALDIWRPAPLPSFDV